jgi:hypothetical protein
VALPTQKKPSTVSLVILSHTVMNGGRFCTNLMCFIDKEPLQIRPKIGGLNYFYRQAGLITVAEQRLWQSGMRAIITPSVTWTGKGTTHPEDVTIGAPGTFKLDTSATRMSDNDLIELVDPFTSNDLYELFPQVVDDHHKPYVPGQPQAASVGYVRMKRVNLDWHGDRMRLRLTHSEAGRQRSGSVAIKGEELLRKINSGVLSEGYLNQVLVRLSLSRPKYYDHLGCRACYVMCSDILGF